MKHLRKKLYDLYKTNNYSDSEAAAEIDFAIEAIAGLSKKDIILGKNPDELSKEKILKIVQRRIKTKEPLAQILGKSYFMNEEFIVSKDTLIPRPETELLVRRAIEIIQNENCAQVLDIGTGSGCIACMIAKLTNAQVLGVDISKDALKIALDNAMKMNLMNRALFRKSDFFSNIDEKFDLIISNPPYIPKKEKKNLQTEVSVYEPELALFTEDEYGIENYEKIISQSYKYLNPNAHLIFEIGINQSKLVKDILEFYGYKNVEILKDLSGTDRVISAVFEK